MVIGKPISGGVPVAAYGMTDEIAAPLIRTDHGARRRRGGVGARYRQRAGARRGAGHVEHDAARRRLRAMIPLAELDRRGRRGIDRAGLDWTVQQLGCRAEYWFCPPPRDGAAAAAAVDDELDTFMHLGH